ncbi:hypothetical protein SRIM_005200 [Streptomyces rimosus subsp. rimosus ATCC 10970]|uniref:Uncharacterized protein n=2 Tax=Streptomyces rimosus subsp. rimosus TaxID=132474 RepID=A0A8A1UJ92_STRR1|nr:DUF5999 family protein [Streptomyces rimosus]MYT45305.1 hypothetical protein [Streptomyces sp. SID5471]QGY66559.1 hypothetical protein V519_012110 [Streptomyces rimosus R6-500]QST79651.1 hypothetical protein SRIM_005200 [Streptomyces rimosus subsp. rimosus ATCC 10970]RSO02484.1 hypothetical protein DMH18_40775 [Streptomyces sp. WAC 06783]RSO21753.1 hypothetical protein DMH15_34450 [Streptomyces sp. WAC 06725]
MSIASSRRTNQTTSQRKISSMCQHQPPCPTADSADREAAHLVAHHPEQGWSLLCNGVLLFEDTGELLPDGQVIAPHRVLGTPHVATAA